MKSDLPPPLTPSDCDLRDFTFMPLDVVRVRDSDIAAVSNGDEFRCAVLLWCASWHQVPAASLPDDDIILSQLAGYGRVVREWQKVRKGALRGWVKCDDGRLYHPVVAEKANEAWAGRLEHREKKEADRQRKAAARAAKKAQEDAELEAQQRGHVPNHPLDAGVLSIGQNGNVQRTGDGNPMENALKERGTVERDSGQLTTNPESSSQASTGVGAGTEDDDRLRPALPRNRNVQISLLLRAQRIEVTSQNPIAIAWAENTKVTDEVLNVAIAKAKAAKPNEAIPVKYLARIVDQLLAEQDAPPPASSAQKPRDSWEWKRTPGGIEAKGRELGMFARGTENHQDFAKRIEAELEKRKGRAA